MTNPDRQISISPARRIKWRGIRPLTDIERKLDDLIYNFDSDLTFKALCSLDAPEIPVAQGKEIALRPAKVLHAPQPRPGGLGRPPIGDGAITDKKVCTSSIDQPVDELSLQPVEENMLSQNMRVLSPKSRGEGQNFLFSQISNQNIGYVLSAALPLAGSLPPDTLEQILLFEFPWLSDVITSIVGDYRLRYSVGQTWLKWRPTLVVGPVSVGKSRLARRIGELTKVGFGEINAGGSADNRSVQGTAAGYSSASPSAIVKLLYQHRIANPIVFVDEIDKTSGNRQNGNLLDSLLSMLEPGSAKAWPDECLCRPVDLSYVNWIAGANDATRLRGPLLDRMRVIHVGRPKPEHFDSLMQGIRRDLATEYGVSDLPELPKPVVDALRTALVKGFSIRKIKSAVEAAVQAGGGLMVGRVLQ